MQRKLILLFLPFLACSPMKTAQQYWAARDLDATIRECKAIVAKDSSAIDAYALLSRAYWEKGVLDSAQLAAETAFRLAPEEVAVRSHLAELYSHRAEQASIAGDLRTVLHFAKQAQATLPDHALYLERLGDIYAQLGRHDQAIEYYQQISADSAVQSRSKSKQDSLHSLNVQAQAEVEKGLQLYQRKSWSAAANRFARARELKPDYDRARYYFHLASGQSLNRKGLDNQLWEAIEHFGLASSIFPDRGEPHFWMATAYHKKDAKEYQNAISEFEMCAQVEPEGPFAKQAREKAAELRAHQNKMQDFWGRK